MRRWIVLACCLLFLKPALAQNTDTDRYDLAFRSDNCIVLFDVEANDQRLLTPVLTEPITHETTHRYYCDQFDPVWSHDGEQVAFTMFNGTSEAAGAINNDLYIVNSDGTNLQNLGNEEVNIEEFPVWSPDGKRITLISNRRWYNGPYGERDFIDLFVMNIDGSNFQHVSDGFLSRPDWSPDGHAIVFDAPNYIQERYAQSDAGPKGNKIYWIDMQAATFTADSLIPLTDEDTDDFNPVWSPDGTRIAYLSGQEEKLAVMGITISSRGVVQRAYEIAHFSIKNLSVYSGLSENFMWIGQSQVAWSPTGETLLVVVTGKSESDIERDQAQNDIYLVNVSRGDAVNLTDQVGINRCPVWSRDGTQIAFLSKRDNQVDIYLMNADGSGLRNLTDDAEPQQCPAWRP